jgi:hypothetical protein
MVDEIQASGSSYRPESISPRIRSTERPSVRAGQADTKADKVEISELALWRAKLADVPEVRADKIASVRVELAANTYETPEKWNIAIDGLVKDLVGGM